MSLGPDYGIMQLNGMFKYGPGLAQDKITYMNHTSAIYKDGNFAVFEESVKVFGVIGKISRCLGCCCPCVPLAINHSPTKKVLKINPAD